MNEQQPGEWPEYSRDEWMFRWDSWRKYIAEGGTASWPRDAFESLLDFVDGLREDAALAQREPVGEGEANAYVKALFARAEWAEPTGRDTEGTIRLMRESAHVLERTEAARLAAEHYAELLFESHKIGALQLEGYMKQVDDLRTQLGGKDDISQVLIDENERLRADHARLANDLVAALAECKVKQETILALRAHDDKDQRHQVYLTLRENDGRAHRDEA